MRLEVFLSFIDFLKDFEKHTILEIASYLELSERTIKRYKAIAINHGYNIESKKGRYGYYKMIDYK